MTMNNIIMGIISRILEVPQIWNLSQFVLGGNASKRKLYRSVFTGKGKMLDFGCADGNTFMAFKDFDYYGIDIDAKFIDYARRKFRNYPNAHWLCADILDMPIEINPFDYILFASTGHHIPDNLIYPILESLIALLKRGGQLYIIDMISKPNTDNWWGKLLIKFDQGQFTRTEAQYVEILSNLQDRVAVINTSIRKMRGNFFPLPDFFIAVLEKM